MGKRYCIDHDAGGAGFTLANLSMFGCSFRLSNCVGCTVTDVNNTHPTYQRTIPPRDPEPGPSPARTTLEGDRSVVRRFSMRYSNNGGLKVVGSDNLIDDSLFEDLTYLPTLDFPPIELGFGSTEPTTARRGGAAAANAGLGAGDQTVGNNNTVRRTTVRRVGEMGILTSQRSNTVEYSHVHHVGMIGLDSAGIHADNTEVSCMNYSIPAAERANCTKEWHHNWVHDCREKCVRGDDYNLNLTVHHSVIFNCGVPSADANRFAATGCILKGDYNQFYANTVFNVLPGSQGELCVPVHGLPGSKGRWAAPAQNAHSRLANSAAATITEQGGPGLNPRSFALFVGMYRNRTLRLRDPAGFDFRPASDSPLRGAGVVVPEIAPPGPGGGPPDVGAYQHADQSPWQAGCTFSSRCAEG